MCIARDTDDNFLRGIVRCANFPGYHLNARSPPPKKGPTYPLHKYEFLKPAPFFHYNHILPPVNLVIDHLMAQSHDLSDGAIDFPAELIQGYAYL
jgi:hypothetical protein